jgi:hypothetical protein
MRRRLSLLFLLAFTALRLDASCGSASCPIDLHALNRPMKGQLTFDFSLQYIDQDQPRILTRRARVGEIPSDHEELRTINRAATLGLAYGITDLLQVSVSTPYVARTHEHIHTASGELEHWNLHGIGDTLVQARYRFGGDFWAMAGVKLPTGSSTRTNGEEPAEVPVQPGSGSTDTIVGLAYEGGIVRATGAQGPLGNSALIPLLLSATYRRNGTAHDYTVGNELQVNAGTAYPLRSNVELLLQANARVRGRDDSPDPEDHELTGGRFLFLSPGVRVSAGRAAWYALIQLPLYQRVNGIQLTSQRNVISGVQMRF